MCQCPRRTRHVIEAANGIARVDIGAKQVVCPDCGKVFHTVRLVQSFDKDRMRSMLEWPWLHSGQTICDYVRGLAACLWGVPVDALRNNST